MENAFIDQVGCKLPFMQQASQDTRICAIKEGNISVTDYYNIWKNIQNSTQKSNCPAIKRCQRTDYELYESHETSIFNHTAIFNLSPLTSTVQYVKDAHTYDAQSFIGEVGGSLGLMLGLSFTSVFDFFEYLLTKLIQE